MPADVFLMLCSSGIALVASLMFLVNDRVPKDPPDDPSRWVSFRLPPLRTPPPLPSERSRCELAMPLPGSRLRMTLCCLGRGEQWEVTVESEPLPDSPALQIRSDSGGVLRGSGSVHDLRWHGRAGLASRARAQWKRPPGRA
ncbi:MAG: hypothetical protein HYZ28_10055 [Myxococcales bacterium]|nr:hypothetical protein [Myxococcales bacterium]